MSRIVTPAGHGLGWHRDLPDQRDFLLGMEQIPASLIPGSVDLRPGCPPVVDQGQIGSCTANAIQGALGFLDHKEHGAFAPPASRLFIYYNERVIEGDVDQDGGAQIRDGIKSVVKQGVCPETDWPYDVDQFAVQPPPSCYAEAQRDRVTRYMRVLQNSSMLTRCLADGYPVVFGFSVYESFEEPEVAQTGVVPMPGPDEQLLGGHAVLLVGYDLAESRYLVRNSWGEGWGMGGYFSMPFAYVQDPNLASDFWSIRRDTA